MSRIEAFGTLSGHISSECTLSGSLSCNGSLSGKISMGTTYPPYSGDYEVTPNAFNAQVLPTANKLLMQDVIVQKIPYYETSNVQEGITVYIAEEVI